MAGGLPLSRLLLHLPRLDPQRSLHTQMSHFVTTRRELTLVLLNLLMLRSFLSIKC